MDLYSERVFLLPVIGSFVETSLRRTLVLFVLQWSVGFLLKKSFSSRKPAEVTTVSRSRYKKLYGWDSYSQQNRYCCVLKK